jgi:hypothetical protein
VFLYAELDTWKQRLVWQNNIKVDVVKDKISEDVK